jgi:hypothetical protein
VELGWPRIFRIRPDGMVIATAPDGYVLWIATAGNGPSDRSRLRRILLQVPR